jgi:D-alanine-D-alanine ligase
MSGRGVLAALKEADIDAFAFDPSQRSLLELNSLSVSRVFIALHGRFGEDGTVQGALEVMGIPYTGSGVLASALALDKYRTKLVWKSVGVPTAQFVQMRDASQANAIIEKLGAPVMVKPSTEGSTIGIVKAHTAAELATAFGKASVLDQNVVVEAFVAGRELTVSVLGDRVLPITEIIAPGGNYDYQNKYFTDDVKYVCPAQIDPAVAQAIQHDTRVAFDSLGCRGWGRADVMLRADGSYEFLEINTAPGMTTHSLVPIAGRAVGLAYSQLCVEILKLASTDAQARRQHVE